MTSKGTLLMPGGGRDLRFDSLRGLMLVTMTVNHLPSMFRSLTDQWFGVFSSAEGFVFISGILAGWVYTRRRRRDGAEAMHKAARHRAGMIYSWHLGAYFACLAAVQLSSWLIGFCSWTNPPLFFQHPWLACLLGSTMLYQPGLLDILPMYCAFVLVLPAVLGALEDGKIWRVLGLSFLAWFVVQWVPPVDGAPLYPVNVGSFNLFAWQFLFVLGAVIGHARIAQTPAQTPFRPLLFAGAAAIGVCGFGVVHFGWRPAIPDSLFGILVNKPNLGAIRLVNFGIAAYLVAVVGSRFPRLFTWPPLALLGQHSLSVFAAQSLAAMIILQFPGLFATTAGNIATTAACVAFLFAVAGAHARLGPWLADGGPFRARQRPALAVSRAA